MIEECTFSENGHDGPVPSGYDAGAGIYNCGEEVYIINCVFDHNSAEYFGAIRNSGVDATIINCLFTENSSTMDGGGGALDNLNSIVNVFNCKFIDNYYLAPGGPAYGHIKNMSSTLNVYSSNLWNFNPSVLCYDRPCQPPEAIIDYSSTSTVYFCNIDNDGYDGINGNIRQDPQFLNTGWDDNGTSNDPSDDVWVGNPDYRLQLTSPCIDTGSNELLPEDTTDLDNDGDTTELLPIDIEGNPRIDGGTVDMGAYEYIQPEGALSVTIALQRSCRYQARIFLPMWKNNHIWSSHAPISVHMVRSRSLKHIWDYSLNPRWQGDLNISKLCRIVIGTKRSNTNPDNRINQK